VGVGVVPGGYALAAGYLAGREDIVATQVNFMQGTVGAMTASSSAQASFAELYDYGLYLDNTGAMGAGLELWRRATDKAGLVPELASTQGSMLAQGALDRALAENCTVALETVNEVRSHPKGPVATFNVGMAAALCGDQTYAEKVITELQQRYPKNTAVEQYYVPQLQAATYIGVNEPEKAINSLIALKQYDQLSLTAYLRGLAHAALGQMPAAILDFQTVLAHRGAAFTMGGNIYPMAEIGMARAYAADRDKTSSVAAYRSFLASWAGGDRSQPMMVEALTKSR